MGNEDYTKITAGKGVKDDAEANQIIARYTRETRRVRQHFGTVMERGGKPYPGGAADEDKKAVPLSEAFISGQPFNVTRQGEKVYIDAPGGEKVRVYDPKNVSEKPGDDGKYDVLRK